LRGDEIRECWEAGLPRDEAPAAGIPRSAPTPATAVEDRTSVRRLEFVEVGVGAGGPFRRRPESVVEESADDEGEGRELASVGPMGPPETRWSLWDDLGD